MEYGFSRIQGFLLIQRNVHANDADVCRRRKAMMRAWGISRVLYQRAVGME